MSEFYVDQLKLVNVRSHKKANFKFHPNVNAIVGINGSGKTTILEAIYTLLRGNSFKGSIGEIMRWGATYANLKLDFNIEHLDRRLNLNQIEDRISKNWQVNEKKSQRLPNTSKHPVVLFEPDIGRMISGSPERRRDYLDNLAEQLDLEMAKVLSRYERTLRQRNQLLKSLNLSHQTKTQLDQLFVWNTQLASLAEKIVTARFELLSQLQKSVTKQYKNLGGTDSITLAYLSKVSEDPKHYASKLLQFLESSLSRDIVLGFTSFGPHRDDMEILLADQPARERASRGEIRTAVLALKLLEAEILTTLYSEKDILPTLLFDDVLSELDLNHQAQILAGFKNYQVFLTTTDAHTLTPGTYTIALD